MNNLDWYTKVTLFCKAYQACTECPFFLLNHEQKEEEEGTEKLCFTSRSSLEALSTWLESPKFQQESIQNTVEEDNQWLKDLLKGQFGADEDDLDAFYMDDEFL